MNAVPPLLPRRRAPLAAAHRTSPRLRAPLAAAAGTLLLAACAVGPDYVTPTAELAPQYRNAPATATALPAEFWRGFGDPALDRLVDAALRQNTDLRLALSRLGEARALLDAADAARWPALTASTGAERTVTAQAFAPGLSRAERTRNSYSAGFDASWEVDFFGRSARNRDAALAGAEAAAAGLDAVRVSLVAETAVNYFDLRSCQQQRVVVAATVERLERSRGVIARRVELGRDAPQDLAQTDALLERTRARLPVLEAGIERARQRLAVLSVLPQDELAPLLDGRPPFALPALTPLEQVDQPQELLRRRPDLRAAERELAAATARIGVATADLYPRLALSGLLGLNALTTAGLATVEAYRYGLGATLSWNALDFGRANARIANAEAQAGTAYLRWEKALRTAIEETEVALSDYTRLSQQTDRLQHAYRASLEAARLARLRFEAGSIDVLRLLTAERDALADEEAFLLARSSQGQALVALVKALGGGWEGAPPLTVAGQAR